MIDDRVRAALKNDIASRLLVGGPKNWKDIQSRYPQVSSATLFRIIKQVKAEQAPPGEPAAEAAVLDGTVVAGAAPSKWAPAAPGLQGNLQANRLISEIAGLFDDAIRLRNYSLDSKGGIKFPAAFLDSAKLRDRAIRTAVGMLGQIHGFAASADMVDAIVEVVSAADPETAKRLMLAMYEIQTANFTPHSKLRRGGSSSGPDELPTTALMARG